MSGDGDDRVRQLQGALELARAGFDEGSRRVEEMHLAIAKRPFDALRHIPVVGATARITEAVHDGVTHGVHAALRGASTFLFRAAIGALDQARMDATAATDDDDAGRDRGSKSGRGAGR